MSFQVTFEHSSFFGGGGEGVAAPAGRLSLVVVMGVVVSYSLAVVRAQASHCGGFSCCRTRALEHVDLVAHSMWNLSSPGIEPVSPVLAEGFLTT